MDQILTQNKTLELAKALIAKKSITPNEAGCQELLVNTLTKLGFSCEIFKFGPPNQLVTNLWAIKTLNKSGNLASINAENGKLLVFAGHIDVVPPGLIKQWHSDPFVPTERNGNLYGRGAADMKSSVAAFVIAAQEFIVLHPQHKGDIALIITSDEEGPGVNGTAKVCEMLKERNINIDYCLVGEPSSVKRLGDTMKNGRRGSLTGKLTIHGLQGHIAYPNLAINPIHLALPALTEMIQITDWDVIITTDKNLSPKEVVATTIADGAFPATSWQISNINAGAGADNVIPGIMFVDFNFRFSPVNNVTNLKNKIQSILNKYKLKYELSWIYGAEPFFSPQGLLSEALTDAVKAECGIIPMASTTGGTSDGRFIAKICKQVIEFGPINASIHKIDENIEIASLESLKNIYRRVLEQLLV